MEVYSDHLAKLFAAENIDVQIEKTSTAYFNPKTRKMAFPTWILHLPVASRELLMLHEASHALHTPEFGTHEAAKEYETVFRNILNILEDKRIEDAMKDKFPGARGTFTRGFYELINANLFGLHFDDDVQEMSLLDRMNLHFKGDYYFECKFTEEEQVWVDRAANNKTFEEVYQNAIELYEHLKEEYSEKILKELEDITKGNFSFDDFEIVDGPGDMPLSDILDSLPDDKREQIEEALENADLEGAKEIIKDAINEGEIDDFTNKEQSISDNSWERSQEKMKDDDDTTAHILNLNLSRYLDWKDFIIPNITVTETIRKCLSMSSSNAIDSFTNFMSKYRKEIDPTIKHMVREFMRKKAAEEYRRTKTSKTGNLDLQKLPHYKYDSNLFLNKAVSNGAKNHGFVLLLDWSGSMGGIMTNAILQLINNVMFCKSIQVPFVAYAFTSSTTHAADVISKSVVHGVDASSIRVGMNLKLIELVDSTKPNYEEQVKHLFYLAYSFMTHSTFSIAEAKLLEQRLKTMNKKENPGIVSWDREKKKNLLVVSDLFELSSTPLNDSLILMNYILPELKKNMNIDVMNLITITDGDSDGMQFPAEYADHTTAKCQAPNSFNTVGDSAGKVRRIGISDEEYAKLQEEHSNLHEKWRNNSDDSKRIFNNSMVYIRSLQSNRVFSLNQLLQSTSYRGRHVSNREMTRKWAALLKHETNVNVIAIELVTHKPASLRRYIGNMYGMMEFEDTEKMIEQYRKNGFMMVEDLGYDKIFVVNVNEISNPEYCRHHHLASYFADYDPDDEHENKEDDHLDKLKENAKGTFTTRALTTALGKNVSRKNKRKFLATCVVEQIAEHQQIKKKKVKINLDIQPEMSYDQEDEEIVFE